MRRLLLFSAGKEKSGAGVRRQAYHTRRNSVKKLLFFDIDGTLAMPGHPPAEDTVRAIRAARAAGHRAFLCTGRGENMISGDIDAIGFDGGIYHAGGRALLDGRIIYENHADPSMLEEVLPVIRDNSIFYTIETTEGEFASAFDRKILADLNLAGANTEMVRMIETVFLKRENTLPDYRGQGIYKVFFFVRDLSDFERIREAVGEKYLSVSFENLGSDMTLTGCEVSRKDINKGKAMEGVCAFLGADMKDTIAFGDSMNDMAMIRAAGLSVAMGNAEPRILEAADVVCESCAEAGVARQLERLGFV